jgi:hypothetical protein
MAVERTTVRRCRRERPCEGHRCPRSIKPGEFYNEHITGPGHPDVGNTRWLRLAECQVCAKQRTGQTIQKATPARGSGTDG